MVAAIGVPVVMVAAIVVGVGLRGPAVPGAGVVPADFVSSSAQATLQQRTADVVIGGSVTGAGRTIPLSGTGQADFTKGSFSADVSANTGGRSVEERELVVDGHFYIGLTVDGSDISSITAGKHWVEIPLPIGGASSSLGSGTADPLSQLQLLTKEGNTVRPLGTAVIDGVTASGFAITPSPQQVRAAIQRAIASGKLPPALQQQLEQSQLHPAAYTFDVWFDASRLMRRMTVSFQTSSSPGTSGSVVMTFESYGTPVTVSPPDPGDVISYADFLAAVQLSNTPFT